MHCDGSSVMYPLCFTGGFGSCNIRTTSQNHAAGIDLTPTPISAAKLRIFPTKQMNAEMSLCMGITLKILFLNSQSEKPIL